MSKRGRYGRHALQDSERSILGGHFNKAINTLDAMNDRVARVTIPFAHGQAEVLSWLFPAETLDKLRAAHPFTKAADRYVTYHVGHVSLLMSYIDVDILPPIPQVMQIDPVAVTPLWKAIAEHEEVYKKFAVVAHVLRWLDAHATAGAIRYYFPAMLSLAPECAVLQEASIGRYVEPQGISEILPLIREASSTIASALMLPKDLVVDNRGMTLTVGQENFTCHGVHLNLPVHSYYL